MPQSLEQRAFKLGLIQPFSPKKQTKKFLKRSFMSGVGQRTLNFFTEDHVMAYFGASDFHRLCDNKGKIPSLSRTQVDMCWRLCFNSFGRL